MAASRFRALVGLAVAVASLLAGSAIARANRPRPDPDRHYAALFEQGRLWVYWYEAKVEDGGSYRYAPWWISWCVTATVEGAPPKQRAYWHCQTTGEDSSATTDDSGTWVASAAGLLDGPLWGDYLRVKDKVLVPFGPVKNLLDFLRWPTACLVGRKLPTLQVDSPLRSAHVSIDLFFYRPFAPPKRYKQEVADDDILSGHMQLLTTDVFELRVRNDNGAGSVQELQLAPDKGPIAFYFHGGDDTAERTVDGTLLFTIVPGVLATALAALLDALPKLSAAQPEPPEAVPDDDG